MYAVRCILICALLAGCGGPEEGPEQALRAWVADAVAAAEDKDRRGLLDKISGNYADARGNDREAIDRMLRIYFLRQQQVVLVSKIDEIRLNADTAADIMMTVGMAGTNSGALGFRADAYQFRFELEHDGDEWLLIGARWGELGQQLN